MGNISNAQCPGDLALARLWYELHLERIHDDTEIRRPDLVQLEQIASGYPSRARFLSELTLEAELFPTELLVTETASPPTDCHLAKDVSEPPHRRIALRRRACRNAARRSRSAGPLEGHAELHRGHYAGRNQTDGVAPIGFHTHRLSRWGFPCRNQQRPRAGATLAFAFLTTCFEERALPNCAPTTTRAALARQTGPRRGS